MRQIRAISLLAGAALAADTAPAMSNLRYTVAMARANGLNTADSQFFINTVHNAYLDWFTPGPSKHPVFGRVISGLDVVKKIEKSPTDGRDRPNTPIQMIKVTVNE